MNVKHLETASVSTIYDEHYECSLCLNNLQATTQRCHSCTEYSVVKKARIVEYLGENDRWIDTHGRQINLPDMERNTASDVTRACGLYPKKPRTQIIKDCFKKDLRTTIITPLMTICIVSNLLL